MEKRESMIFYGSWLEAVKNLPREMQGEVLTAIIEYGLSGETTASLKPVTKAMLAMAKGQIDANRKKYENGVVNGKKGGRPKREDELPLDFDSKESESHQDQQQPQANENDTKGEKSDEPKDDSRTWESYYLKVMNMFNYAIQSNGSSIKPVRAISNYRRNALYQLAKKYGYKEDAFKQAFRNVAMSNYCNGRTKERQKPADFDWIIREENFDRAYEGSL